MARPWSKCLRSYGRKKARPSFLEEGAKVSLPGWTARQGGRAVKARGARRLPQGFGWDGGGAFEQFAHQVDRGDGGAPPQGGPALIQRHRQQRLAKAGDLAERVQQDHQEVAEREAGSQQLDPAAGGAVARLDGEAERNVEDGAADRDDVSARPRLQTVGTYRILAARSAPQVNSAPTLSQPCSPRSAPSRPDPVATIRLRGGCAEGLGEDLRSARAPVGRCDTGGLAGMCLG